jgi:predicted N-acetyltransferase YhbS
MTAQPSTPLPALTLQPEQPQDGPSVDALIARAFGPGRYTKVSERVREFATFAPELSVCAWSQGRLMGCARMWRVRVGGRPVMFLGPFAVEQGERNAGFGARLIARACEAAQAAGESHVLLVGDEAYFGRVGFARAAGREVILPGPVDQDRVLVRTLTPDAGDIAGPVEPA